MCPSKHEFCQQARNAPEFFFALFATAGCTIEFDQP